MSSTNDDKYPPLVRRVRAVLLDGVVISVSAVGMILLLPRFGLGGVYAVLGAILSIFLLEPVLVSASGGTIGHHLNRIRVQSTGSGKNLDILRATIRFVIKSLLGLLAFFTIFSTERYQAIHDLLSGSVVVLKTPEKELRHDVLSERIAEQGYVYPIRTRRVVVFFGYVILSFVVLVFLIGASMSDECLLESACDIFEEILVSILDIAWFTFLGVSFHYCWKCRMWGCRRVKIQTQAVWKEPHF